MAPPVFVRALLGRLGSLLLPAHLLRLEVLVEEEERRLVGLGGAHDGEHALTSLIMRRLSFLVSTPQFYAGDSGYRSPWQWKSELLRSCGSR